MKAFLDSIYSGNLVITNYVEITTTTKHQTQANSSLQVPLQLKLTLGSLSHHFPPHSAPAHIHVLIILKTSLTVHRSGCFCQWQKTNKHVIHFGASCPCWLWTVTGGYTAAVLLISINEKWLQTR